MVEINVPFIVCETKQNQRYVSLLFPASKYHWFITGWDFYILIASKRFVECIMNSLLPVWLSYGSYLHCDFERERENKENWKILSVFSQFQVYILQFIFNTGDNLLYSFHWNKRRRLAKCPECDNEKWRFKLHYNKTQNGKHQEWPTDYVSLPTVYRQTRRRGTYRERSSHLQTEIYPSIKPSHQHRHEHMTNQQTVTELSVIWQQQSKADQRTAFSFHRVSGLAACYCVENRAEMTAEETRRN